MSKDNISFPFAVDYRRKLTEVTRPARFHSIDSRIMDGTLSQPGTKARKLIKPQKVIYRASLFSCVERVHSPEVERRIKAAGVRPANPFEYICFLADFFHVEQVNRRYIVSLIPIKTPEGGLVVACCENAPNGCRVTLEPYELNWGDPWCFLVLGEIR